MNIRVDLNLPINDGTEVVFRSPVDCSQVTGLIVYYPDNGNTISKEFAFADAHGNNVGDIDHLFAEDVVVKVILDVTKSMAFVQNADTNAYLEGRFAECLTRGNDVDLGEHMLTAERVVLKSNGTLELEASGQKLDADGNLAAVCTVYGDKNKPVILSNVAPGVNPDEAVNVKQLKGAELRMVDKLCPTFTESGAVVTCEPVEGYPLKVVSHLAELETGHTKAVLHRCGKNLLNLANRTAVTYNAWETTTKRSFDGKKAFLGLTTDNNFLGSKVTSYIPTETGATFTSATMGYCVGYDFPVTPGMMYMATNAENLSMGICFYTKDGTWLSKTTGKPVSATAPKSAAWGVLMLVPVSVNTEIQFTNVRVWVGTMNAFEPYKGDYFTADFGRTVMGGSFDWGTGILTDENGMEYELSPQQILGQSGLNTIYSSTGNTDVNGSSNPVAIIDKLTKAVISLGGNV